MSNLYSCFSEDAQADVGGVNDIWGLWTLVETCLATHQCAAFSGHIVPNTALDVRSTITALKETMRKMWESMKVIIEKARVESNPQFTRVS